MYHRACKLYLILHGQKKKQYGHSIPLFYLDLPILLREPTWRRYTFQTIKNAGGHVTRRVKMAIVASTDKTIVAIGLAVKGGFDSAAEESRRMHGWERGFYNIAM